MLSQCRSRRGHDWRQKILPRPRGERRRGIERPERAGKPGGSVRGEQANFTRLVLGSTRSQILQVNSTEYSLGSSRRDLHNPLLCTFGPRNEQQQHAGPS